MGPSYRRITEDIGLLEKVRLNLLIIYNYDYHLTEFIITFLFYIHKYELWIFVH
jgi:hypothetical protein